MPTPWRQMKMGDGGFRPAFNVQFATAADSQVITGADVVNSGGDTKGNWHRWSSNTRSVIPEIDPRKR